MRFVASSRLIAALTFLAAMPVLPALAQSVAAPPAQGPTESAESGSPIFPTAELTLMASGRTIAASSDIRAGVLRVAVLGTLEAIKICNDETLLRPGPIRLRYLVLPDVASPRELSESEGDVIMGQTNGAFVTKPVPDGHFALLNLYQEKSPDAAEAIVAKCWKSIGDSKERLADLESDINKYEQQVRVTQALMATVRQRIDSQRADAAAFGGKAEAAGRIAEILKRVEDTRAVLTKAEADLADSQASLVAAQDALAAAPDKIRGELGMSLSDAEYSVTMLTGGALLKIGGILVSPSKGVYYDFATYSPRSSLQLMPMGDYPVVRYGDRQFAIVANVIPAQHPYSFYLAASAQDGVVVNTEPVRPTFAVAEAEAAARGATPPKRRATSRTYTDIILPIRGTFAPNQYPEVTLSTERAADDDPKKRTTVTLVDKAKYPQFRAFYRYNFNTGVFGSRLRSSEFTKVRTRDDDSTTEDVDESFYRIQEVRSDGPVKPIFAFTYYLKPVDVQARVSHERWIPNPTIGFAIGSPADNIYFGFSHEVLRNAQLFWGWHWGPSKDLVVRNDASEDRDSSAPATREKREIAFGFGLTFNVAVITKIFK